MHKPHSERPKHPGLPRRRPEVRPPGSEANAAGMPRTLPILPVAPENKQNPQVRTSMRLGWSKAIVDQAQRGEVAFQQPGHVANDIRPVRSQAAARARAGAPAPASLPAIDQLPNPEPALPSPPPAAAQFVWEPPTPDEASLNAGTTESGWTKLRARFGSLLRMFSRD